MAFNKLTVLGHVPAGGPCPFRDHCFTAHSDACYHLGTDYGQDHDCHSARFFDWDDQEKSCTDSEIVS